MTKTASTIARLASAIIIACAAAAATAPALAQSANMPTLSFPTEGGQWGCAFTRTCTIANPAPLERLRRV